MKNEEHDDFAAKLLQIEEQANMALNDLPAGLTRDRVQHIAIVARMLRLPRPRGRLRGASAGQAAAETHLTVTAQADAEHWHAERDQSGEFAQEREVVRGVLPESEPGI